MKDVFRSGDSSKKFKIAEGQWYRYAPSYVSPAYHLLEGFPFIQEPPSGDLQERVLIRHHDYDQCFQSVQLLQWNSQVKFNVTVYRNLPTTRGLIMFQTFISRHNSNFFSDKLVLTSVTPASSAPVLQTPKATSSTLYFDSLTANAGNGGFLHCSQMDTSVNAANLVGSVGADIAFDGRHDGGYSTVKDCVTIDVLPRTPGNNVYVGFMVWSNFTATKCRGLVSLNQVIKEIICLQPLKWGDLCLVLLVAVLLRLLLVAPCLNCLEAVKKPPPVAFKVMCLLPITILQAWVMLVLNLPFKALMFLTLMRPSLVLFLVLWLKLVKDFLKVRCRLALLLVWFTPDLRIKKSLLKCNWTIRKRLPRCKMRLKKRLLAFSRRLHARIRKTRYMHKMRCLLINRRSLLLALRLLWKTPIFPSNSRFPRLCAKCLLKLKQLVSILPMTKSKK